MSDPRLDAFARAVTDTVCYAMEFGDPKQEADFRASCESLVRLHVDAAQGNKTMELYIRLLAEHDAMRFAMKAHIHHLKGTDESRNVALYVAHAEDIARKQSR